MFALFAVTVGTTPLRDLVNMSLYLLLFLLGTVLLAFWVLPALISALAPVGHREVVRELREAVTIRCRDDALRRLAAAGDTGHPRAGRALRIRDSERDDTLHWVK